MNPSPALNEAKAEEAIHFLNELLQLLPGGVNSPVRALSGLERRPLLIESASQDRVTDLSGRSYIDLCCSWGALILGHANPRVLEALASQLPKGTSYGITSRLEGEIARQVVALMPSIELVRFVSSGSEATMSAARLARGFTGREVIVKFNGNYHGHADLFLVQAGSGLETFGLSSSAGVPQGTVEKTLSLPYNDLGAIRRLFADPNLSHTIAAVIVEPVSGNMGVVPPEPGFLELLRSETERTGALLIFDEVITGFRVSKGGAQELYGIKPDLSCIGKIVAGGLPAAAFGGRREIMSYLAPLGPVYQAGTLSGNPLAMCAGLATLQAIQEEGFYAELERKCHLLLDPVEEAIFNSPLPIALQRVGSMFTLFFGRQSVRNLSEARECDPVLFKRFFGSLLDRGIYLPPSPFESSFISSAHSDNHLTEASEAICAAIHSLG